MPVHYDGDIILCAFFINGPDQLFRNINKTKSMDYIQDIAIQKQNIIVLQF